MFVCIQQTYTYVCCVYVFVFYCEKHMSIQAAPKVASKIQVASILLTMTSEKSKLASQM